ncbi:HAMP domain-containing protein [Saccharopolyspora sp. HNM0986]|uniref:ATP-binding protein n=1 Tax=Saccharopolyspora galaxeae TaxID=2781241 RepID=UPI001909F807|nr:ATP-binding protein [Saccharopolyspora sp. HNM0986]MBK0869387.1 HAMP domain-containing protein [Saccharopolyspora sp. HNM0986]
MSERPRRLSVRTRTTLTATAIVALATVGIGLLLVGYLQSRLTSDLEATVHEQLSEATEAVRRGAALPDGGNEISVRLMRPEDRSAAVPPAGPSPSERPPLAESNVAPQPAAPNETSAAPQPAPSAEPVAAPARQVAATTTVVGPGGTATLVASASTRSVQQATAAATAALLLASPVLLAIVAALTWFSTGRALRPVEEIRDEFARLSAHDLRGRMPVPAGRDEVARLAGTLNETLDRLDHSVRRQRQFVADASHELRSPLAALRTPLEVACAHPDRVEWPDIAAGTLEDLGRLEQLTGDLLALARLDGTPATGGTAIDLGELVRDVLQRRAPGDIEWDTALESGVVIDGHRSHLVRLITNLADNAERHAARSARISVRAEDGHARLNVADDGPGVPAESREYVFERFARLDSARGRGEGGAGLGLALAREIAALHQGTLGITDSGRGANFAARFPLAEDRADATDPALSAAARRSPVAE